MLSCGVQRLLKCDIWAIFASISRQQFIILCKQNNLYNHKSQFLQFIKISNRNHRIYVLKIDRHQFVMSDNRSESQAPLKPEQKILSAFANILMKYETKKNTQSKSGEEPGLDLENKEDKNEEETNINPNNQIVNIPEPIQVDDDKVEEVQIVNTPAKRLRSKKSTKKEAKHQPPDTEQLHSKQSPVTPPMSTAQNYLLIEAQRLGNQPEPATNNEPEPKSILRNPESLKVVELNEIATKHTEKAALVSNKLKVVQIQLEILEDRTIEQELKARSNQTNTRKIVKVKPVQAKQVKEPLLQSIAFAIEIKLIPMPEQQFIPEQEQYRERKVTFRQEDSIYDEDQSSYNFNRNRASNFIYCPETDTIQRDIHVSKRAPLYFPGNQQQQDDQEQVYSPLKQPITKQNTKKSGKAEITQNFTKKNNYLHYSSVQQFPLPKYVQKQSHPPQIIKEKPYNPPIKAQPKQPTRLQSGRMNTGNLSLLQLLIQLFNLRIINSGLLNDFREKHSKKDILQFLQKFKKGKLHKFDFTSFKFTILDHRRLAELMVTIRPELYYLGPLNQSEPEVQEFLTSLYALSGEQYCHLYQKIDRISQIKWWSKIILAQDEKLTETINQKLNAAKKAEEAAQAVQRVLMNANRTQQHKSQPVYSEDQIAPDLRIQKIKQNQLHRERNIIKRREEEFQLEKIRNMVSNFGKKGELRSTGSGTVDMSMRKKIKFY